LDKENNCEYYERSSMLLVFISVIPEIKTGQMRWMGKIESGIVLAGI
jgi:hypothetical protein